MMVRLIPAVLLAAGVRFAKVRLTLDYQDLHHENQPTNVNLEYYITLPIGNVTFTNAGRGQTTRFTCNVPGDPFALDRDAFCDQVLVPCASNGLVDLLPPAIVGHDCTLDTTSIIQRLHRQILTFAIDSIFESLREQDAPGYSSTAYSTCEKITMSFTDSDGNSHSLSVLEYHKALLQGASPFLDQPMFQYNLANHFASIILSLLFVRNSPTSARIILPSPICLEMLKCVNLPSISVLQLSARRILQVLNESSTPPSATLTPLFTNS
jgi:hypothetical protein